MFHNIVSKVFNIRVKRFSLFPGVNFSWYIFPLYMKLFVKLFDKQLKETNRISFQQLIDKLQKGSLLYGEKFSEYFRKLLKSRGIFAVFSFRTLLE